jgi:hypothetical protein
VLQVQPMELLLNLIWMALAVGVLCAFASRRRSSPLIAQVPCVKGLLALTCGLVLLFPIISASDDLHPVQAVMEDASKRLQQVVGPVSPARNGPPVAILPALLAVQLSLALVVLRLWRPRTLAVSFFDRDRVPADGRAPPSVLY